MRTPDPHFWLGRRVLITGHTGFKGSWLALWLHRLGARVTGVALPAPTSPSLFELARVEECVESHLIADIRDGDAIARIVDGCQPEIVLHLAAQALVRPAYENPLATYSTNIMGTAHVLDALRGSTSAKVAVVVTTDKVYRNREWSYPYREDDALGGHDPYSASKAASELVVASYRDAFLAAQGVAVATARAGNVIGGGDWAIDRLLPDAIRAWDSGQTLQIRHPRATRPWQHVLEPLAAYLRLAEQLWVQPGLAGAYNFGPLPSDAATVGDVIQMASKRYPASETSYHEDSSGPHEANWLALETAYSRSVLGVVPRWCLATAVARTMEWYIGLQNGGNARSLCVDDIDAWETVA